MPVAGELPGDRWRRLLNVVLAAVGLIVCAPIMVLAAVLIKLTSGGPVLYTQLRVGLDRRRRAAADACEDGVRGNGREPDRRQLDYGGALFRIYKFRTMCNGADREGQVWARPDDPRITPLGRTLRAYRVDELPQLFNVLKGDMNLVGPRPEQPEIFARLDERLDAYAVRQRVRPGITGLAQVNHHYDRSIEDVREKLEHDLRYGTRRSVAGDLRILLRTIPVVLLRRGAL